MINGREYINGLTGSPTESEVRPIWKRISNWWKGKTSKEEDVISANEAFCRATYGENMTTDTLIKVHQHQLNKLIKEKISFNYDKNSFGYRCVYSFPEDMKPYIEEVLKPFSDKGYKIINLSEKVEELKADNVYLISWYKTNI